METTDTMLDDLQRLLDHRDIQDLVIRYCRAVDRADWEALRTLYHEDATDDHGSLFQGSASQYIDRLPLITKGMSSTFHQISNHLIALQGDRAEGEVYIVAYHLKTRSCGNEEQVITAGRYLDRYTRDQGVWKFLSRKAVMDWNEVQPARRPWPITGARQELDPSASYFEWLGRTEARPASC